MTRRWALTFLAVLVGFLVTGRGTVRAHEEYRWVGTISKLDPKMTRMTMTWMEGKKQQSQVVVITEATSVTRNGTGVARTELKIGRSVVVIAMVDPDRPFEVP